MLSSLLEAHYQARECEFANERKRHCDALRIDDIAQSHLYELAKKYVDVPIVANLAASGPDYMPRLLNVVYYLEYERVREQNIALQSSVVDLGRQIIEARAELRVMEARLMQQEQRHCTAVARDLQARRAMADRAVLAALAALPGADIKNPAMQAVREAFIHHVDVLRVIYSSSSTTTTDNHT